MRSARTRCAAAVYDNALYVLGGTSNSSTGSYLETYRPPRPPSCDRRGSCYEHQVTWKPRLVHMHGARCEKIAQSERRDPICDLSCGTFVPETPLRSVEQFNGSEWSQAPDMIQARAGCAAAVYDGALYVLGGRVSDGTVAPGSSRPSPMACLSSVERFDGSTWSQVPNMMSKRYGCSAVVSHGYLYVFGGHDGESALSSVERFDGNRWSRVPNMAEKRDLCAAAIFLKKNKARH